jgi:hypothetical protein
MNKPTEVDALKFRVEALCGKLRDYITDSALAEIRYTLRETYKVAYRAGHHAGLQKRNIPSSIMAHEPEPLRSTKQRKPSGSVRDPSDGSIHSS